jgi:hypothetical protein
MAIFLQERREAANAVLPLIQNHHDIDPFPVGADQGVSE